MAPPENRTCNHTTHLGLLYSLRQSNIGAWTTKVIYLIICFMQVIFSMYVKVLLRNSPSKSSVWCQWISFIAAVVKAHFETRCSLRSSVGTVWYIRGTSVTLWFLRENVSVALRGFHSHTGLECMIGKRKIPPRLKQKCFTTIAKCGITASGQHGGVTY